MALTAACVMLLAGCSNPQESAGGGAGGPGGGPGRGPGQTVAANASAAEIYGQKCQNCHGANGQGASGPAIAGGGGEPDANLKTVIANGKGKMPAFASSLSPAQIDSLVAHIKGLGR